jgi:hypothetical protein
MRPRVRVTVSSELEALGACAGPDDLAVWLAFLEAELVHEFPGVDVEVHAAPVLRTEAQVDDELEAAGVLSRAAAAWDRWCGVGAGAATCGEAAARRG